MFTSLSGIMIIVLEFGFGFGATRAVAAQRDRPELVAKVVSDVLGARIILSLAVSMVWVALWFLLPVVHGAPAAYWWMLALTLIQGASFAWYFQAVGRLPFSALLDITARAASTVLILIFVQVPSQNDLVPFLQFSTIAVTFSVTLRSMYRSIPFKFPTISGSLRLLGSNAYISGLRIVQGMASMGNTFLVGVIAPGSLAIYGASERTSNAVRSMVIPVTQVAFPEFVAIAARDRPRARLLLRRVLLTLILAGLSGAVVLSLFANPIIYVLFGSKFLGAADVFRILSWTLPLFAISQTLGSQWMLAIGHDRPFFIAIISGFLLNVGAAIVVVPLFGAIGMACCFASSELVVAIIIVVYVEFFAPLDSRVIRRIETADRETHESFVSQRNSNE